MNTANHTTIDQAHWDEWTIDSGVAAHIVESNVRSLHDPREIDKLLNRNNEKRWQHWEHGAGWGVTGVDEDTGEVIYLGCQFKPDKPVQQLEKGQPKFKRDGSPNLQKYISASGYPAEPLFLDTGIQDYWLDIQTDVTKPILLTEGAKKAGAGLSIGYATISLPGVTTGQKLGRINARLKKFCSVGRTVYLAFDSDMMTNPLVCQALDKHGRLISAEGAVVKVILLPEDTKAMDDFKVKYGSDEFRKFVENAATFEEWRKGLEKQFQEPGKTGKIPPADLIGQRLAEDYRDKLAFNNETLTWMRYEADYPGCWSSESQEYIEAIVSNILDSKGITGYGSHSYITNVTKKMRSHLIVRKWIERSPKELLPFTNGVLEVATKKLLDHSPSYRFTWSIARNHNILASDWEPINQWMDQATGNNHRIKKILLCWLNAALKGRSDLHRFLHLTGPGGSGKGTFIRLCIALLGDRNNHSSNLEDWNGNRFEPANAYRKRLITFPDEDKYAGGLGRFKSLTGGDYLRGEEKGKKAFQYIYDGMVMVASNYPIFAGDVSSGLARRLLLVPFTHPPTLRRDLDKEFAPYLDALTNYVLSIPDEEVTNTLSSGNDSPEIVEQAWDYRMRTDSIAAWLNECCIHDENSMEAIGADKDNEATLFGSYHQYCQRTGSRAKGSREFSPSLLDLCNHILNWADVEKISRNNGKFIKGLRLRGDGDTDLANPIEALSIPKVTGGTRHGDGWSDGSEPLLHMESDGCDGSNQLIEKIEFQIITDQVEKILEFNIEEVTLHPSHPSLSSASKGFDPSLDPSVTGGSPVTASCPVETGSPVEVDLEVGERVKVVMAGSSYHEQTGTVRRIFQERSLMVYSVQFADKRRFDYQRSDLKRL